MQYNRVHFYRTQAQNITQVKPAAKKRTQSETAKRTSSSLCCFTQCALAHNSDVCVSVEQIGGFCNPNPVQNFHWVIRSDPNPVDLSKYLVQSGLHPKKHHWQAFYFSDQCSLDIHIGSGWVFRNPVRSGSGFKLQNPVGSRSGNRVMFNTGVRQNWTQVHREQCSNRFLIKNHWIH